MSYSHMRTMVLGLINRSTNNQLSDFEVGQMLGFIFQHHGAYVGMWINQKQIPSGKRSDDFGKSLC